MAPRKFDLPPDSDDDDELSAGAALGQEGVGSVEGEGVTEFRVQAEEWLPAIRAGNEVLTCSLRTSPLHTISSLPR